MKKGFTLIEIILSITLIVVIGTVSIFSFNIIKKNNKEKTLESMSETIYNAVNVYLESNSDVKNELYTNKNGLKIPLTTLENSGLVDFGSLSDDLSDEEDFVVTMLGTGNPDDDHCANTYTAKSWNITSGETIYICEKSDGSNAIMVTGDTSNLNILNKEAKFVRRGAGYIIYEENLYHIYYVDKDDSLVLLSSIGFGNIFNNLTQNIRGLSTDAVNEDNSIYCTNGDQIGINWWGHSTEILNGQLGLIESDFLKLHDLGWLRCITINKLQQSLTNIPTFSSQGYGQGVSVNIKSVFKDVKKIHLKPCMKITSGVGDDVNPYILTNKCN